MLLVNNIKKSQQLWGDTLMALLSKGRGYGLMVVILNCTYPRSRQTLQSQQSSVALGSLAAFGATLATRSLQARWALFPPLAGRTLHALDARLSALAALSGGSGWSDGSWCALPTANTRQYSIQHTDTTDRNAVKQKKHLVLLKDTRAKSNSVFSAKRDIVTGMGY